MWNPWRGCHRYSEGCRFCYIHKGDSKRGVDTDRIVRCNDVDFYVLVARNKLGLYQVRSGQRVFLCFSTDFLIAEADLWRGECWTMIRERSDLHFLFLTKRIERFMSCIPDDWGKGYDNVTIGCTVENQKTADHRLSIFATLPIKHKNIICQPLIEHINITSYLQDIELVVVGGESDKNARPLNYDWVLDIREQCIQQRVPFEFRQCGTRFIKDGKQTTLNVRDLYLQAKQANINYQPVTRVTHTL
jgi:protein gp37